jgi:K+ transporter
VVAGLENNIDEIEDQLFDGDAAASRQVYDLSGSSRRSLRRWGRSQPQSWMTRAETSSKSPHVRNPPPVRQAIAIQAASVKMVAWVRQYLRRRRAGNVSMSTRARAALALGALGVVFGDLGTSPLYTVQTVFNPNDPHPVPAVKDNIYGVISLIFWSVTIIVTITYVLLVMRADNHGEGGIMALITLIRRGRPARRRRTTYILAALGVFGASLFFGDSMITPAISVLSAIEGVKIAAPSVADLVVPITAVILICLFLIQRLGTASLGRLFGPVMAIWFATIGACGARGIVDHPAIVKALLPSYALGFLVNHFSTAFFSLAAVVLAVTGAEALYADMGHFGRAPISRVWLLIVFPACMLSYMGRVRWLSKIRAASLATRSSCSHRTGAACRWCFSLLLRP